MSASNSISSLAARPATRLPPKGIQPREVFYEHRILVLRDAIERYQEAGFESDIPKDWFLELWNLERRYNVPKSKHLNKP